MCYEAKCSSCGKVTWGGCGRHVPSVYNRIEEANRCMCKEWPGVSEASSSSQNQQPKSGDSSCNIL